MKAYPVYQDSGIPWLGMIPEHWEIEKITKHFQFGKGLSITKADLKENGVPVISYGQIHSKQNKGVHENSSLIRFVDEDYLKTSSKALVGRNDIIFADTSEDLKGVGNCVRISRTGHIFAGYHTIIAFKKMAEDTKFWAYLMQSELWRNQLRSHTNGVKVFSISQRNLRKCVLITPPQREQRAIVAYLDKKCTEIQELINRRQTMIELLKELKRSIIAKAVTKGLNPDGPMKDSGIPWLGKIPEHWAARKIKTLFRIKKEIAGKEGLNVLSITQQGIKIKDIESNEGQIAQSYTNYQLLEVGEFAMNHMDLLTGWVGISPFNGVTSPDYRVFVRSEENASSKYLLYALQTCYSRKLFYGLAQGVSSIGRCRLQTSKFKNFVLPFPSVEEQKAIVAYLDKKCPDIDNLISRHEQSIEKLKELRTATIANVVTGKVDVRDSI